MCSFPSAPASEMARVAYVSVAAWLMVKYCIFGWHRIKYDGISHWAGQQCNVFLPPLSPQENIGQWSPGRSRSQWRLVLTSHW